MFTIKGFSLYPGVTITRVYCRQGIAQVSALGSSEASAPQRFNCISIMGYSNGGSTTVRSRGGVLSREGPFSEVPLNM